VQKTFSNLFKRSGVGKCAFSTANWPYLGNGEKYGQDYY